MATSKEIKDGYTSTLQDLTCNSKPLISVLTMLAEENVAHAKDIVEAIETHLSKVRNEVKLPVLYLIDCIIKNVGGPYTAFFCTNIVTLFCNVFQVVDEKTRTEMYKLRQTWNEVLPKSKLYALDVQTKQMDPAWPITAPPPNIHFNPKFLKSGAGIKSDATNTKPVNAISTSATDPTTLDMQQKLILKQRELLELQQKKLELELLQTQVKLQEQLKKSSNNTNDDASKVNTQTTKLLLKPEVAKQLLDEPSESTTINKALLNQRITNNSSNVGNNVPKIAPVNSALITAARPIRDPRLLRQQTAQQINVNSNVQLENKSNTTNTLDNKVVSNKMSSRVERPEARFVNNKDEPPKTTKTLSRIPLKSKRSSSPNSKSSSKSSGRSFKSGSGSTSSLDSPSKSSSKSSRSSSKSPSKYKKSGSSSGSSSSSTRYDKKGGKSSKSDRKSPIKDGFKDVKGATKNRNYIRRNREVSVSPEPESRHDVDLRVGGPPGKQARIQSDSKEDKCDLSIQGMDVDLRHMPAIVGKKRASTESSEPPISKKSKSEMFDFLFGNEDVDLRQLQVQAKNTRPPTPPPPIISNKTQNKNNSSEKENSTRNGSPAKETSPKVNLDALRAKLANATNKDKIKQSRFQDEPKKGLDDTLKKIIISPADEECIKAGNMTKAQESALMNKIIAQIENQKLKEAKRKENEEIKDTQPVTSDEEFDQEEENVDKMERYRDPNDDYLKHSGFEQRPRRPTIPVWRGSRRGGGGYGGGGRGPIRPLRSGIEPWIRPLNAAPHWRPPFGGGGNKFDDAMHPDLMDARSNSPIFTNSNDGSDLVMNCSNQYDSKSINIDGEPRDIIFYDETAIAFMSWEDPREITFQNGTRRVKFNDESFMFAFNEPYREVIIKGSPHNVRLGAPTREIYVDGKFYECYFDGPGITIELDGQLVLISIEGPAPQVKIGTVRRTDLVAGKINLIIDAKIIVPVYLDARKQTFDIDGKIHTLRFTDALQTVLINDVPFKVEFGGLPKPITVNEKKHFVRFSVLPRGIKPGAISIKDMDGCKPIITSDNENSQDACDNSGTFKKKSRFSDDSPERSSNSPISIQNLLQQPTLGNLDSFFSNVMATAPSSNTAQTPTTLGYQIENPMDQEDELRTEIQPAATETAPPSSILPSTLNINELFQKLVATGIVTSNVPVIPSTLPSNPIIPTATTIPIIDEQFENPDVPQTKSKKVDLQLKVVDFTKPSTLKIRQPALINALYSGMQCSSCGMRFSPEQSMLYSQHLDWHFRQNRKGKKNIRKATSRRWYYSIADWNNYEEIEDLDEREKCYFENQQTEKNDGTNDEGEEEIEIPSVPADSEVPEPHCDVCQEKFEQFYNEEKEEWHLRMAIRIDNRTYHPLCYDDYQASLLNSTLEDVTINQTISEEMASKDVEIPGLELPKEDDDSFEKDTTEIIIDDLESSTGTGTPKVDEIEETTIDSTKPESETDEKPDEEVADEDEDDVIINEMQPERINLDEYEFKNLDENGLIPGVTVKQEPIDDGFTDIENFNLGEVKIKIEPNQQDEEFEDIGHVTEVPDEVPKEPPSNTQNAAELVTSIDGNVELNSGVPPPAGGISGKIKINISKQLPVIAPKENKDISLDVDNNIEPLDPIQPLPPGEEPVQLHLKPALQGIELKKLPPVTKGSELTGLCSIM